MMNSKNKIDYFIFFLIPFLSGVIYLLAFFPGVLSFDSIYQWQQLSEMKFTDWHPAYHTIIMWLLTRLWYSPAIIALFQIICFSGVVAYCAIVFRYMGVPTPLLIGVVLISSINLINGIMVITLWKDILYSISVLLFTAIMLRIIITNGNWLNKYTNIILISFTAANIILLRHDGFPVVIISIIMLLLIYRDNWKRIIFSSIVVMVYVLLIKGPVYDLFRVNKANSQKAAVALIHPIAAHLQNAPDLSVSDRYFLNSIFPLANKWPYSCYDATVLFYKGVNFKPVNENQIKTIDIFMKLTLLDFRTTMEHYICVSSFTWQISQPNNVYLETILLRNFDASTVELWKPYTKITSQRSILVPIRDFIIKINDYVKSMQGWQILWRPAIYMYSFIFAVLVLSIMQVFFCKMDQVIPKLRFNRTTTNLLQG